jgi:hypothetical protein
MELFSAAAVKSPKSLCDDTKESNRPLETGSSNTLRAPLRPSAADPGTSDCTSLWVWFGGTRGGDDISIGIYAGISPWTLNTHTGKHPWRAHTVLTTSADPSKRWDPGVQFYAYSTDKYSMQLKI